MAIFKLKMVVCIKQKMCSKTKFHIQFGSRIRNNIACAFLANSIKRHREGHSSTHRYV